MKECGTKTFVAHPSTLGVLDPRTLALFVVVVNLVLTAHVSDALFAAALALAGVALALSVGLRPAAGWLIFVLFWVALSVSLPHLWHSPVAALLGYLSRWMFLFAGIIGATVAAAAALDVARVGAVLTQLRAPRVLFVPIMVIVRFFPMAVAELRSIVQAMALRGLEPGAWSLLRHPARTAEYVAIPFLASAARIADELSAAAIIKGLGAQRGRSVAQPSRFSRADAVALTLLAALSAWWMVEIFR